MKRVGMLVGALLLVIGAVSCGGGGDGETTVAKAEFAKQANAICSEAHEDRAVAVDKALKGNVAEGDEMTIAIEAALPPIVRMTEQLAQLDPPEGDADKAEAMVAAFETAVAGVKANPASMAEGKGDPFDPATEIAAELNIPACAVS